MWEKLALISLIACSYANCFISVLSEEPLSRPVLMVQPDKLATSGLALWIHMQMDDDDFNGNFAYINIAL